jgi:hypothetical protein
MMTKSIMIIFGVMLLSMASARSLSKSFNNPEDQYDSEMSSELEPVDRQLESPVEMGFPRQTSKHFNHLLRERKRNINLRDLINSKSKKKTGFQIQTYFDALVQKGKLDFLPLIIFFTDSDSS